MANISRKAKTIHTQSFIVFGTILVLVIHSGASIVKMSRSKQATMTFTEIVTQTFRETKNIDIQISIGI